MTPLAIGDAPLVVDDRHERRLAAWRPIRLTSSLGHGVDPSWGGVVAAEAVPGGARWSPAAGPGDAGPRALLGPLPRALAETAAPQPRPRPATAAPGSRATAAPAGRAAADAPAASVDPRPVQRQADVEVLRAEAREVARRTSRTPAAPAAPAAASVPVTRVAPVAPAPAAPVPADDAPGDAVLDRQARLLYPRVRALLDEDLARDRQRAGRYPAGW